MHATYFILVPAAVSISARQNVAFPEHILHMKTDRKPLTIFERFSQWFHKEQPDTCPYHMNTQTTLLFMVNADYDHFRGNTFKQRLKLI